MAVLLANHWSHLIRRTSFIQLITCYLWRGACYVQETSHVEYSVTNGLAYTATQTLTGTANCYNNTDVCQKKDPFACCSIPVLVVPSFMFFSRDILDYNCFIIARRFHFGRSWNSAAVVPLIHIRVWGKSLVQKTTDRLLDPQLTVILKNMEGVVWCSLCNVMRNFLQEYSWSNDATRQSGRLTQKSTCLHRNSLIQISHCKKNHQNKWEYYLLLTKHNQKCHGCLGKLP